MATTCVEFTQSGDADFRHHSTVEGRAHTASKDSDLHPPSCIPSHSDRNSSAKPSAPEVSSIAIATREEELVQIGRLRYDLFIERDGKSYPGADRHRRLFLEPVDRCSLNFFGMTEDDCAVAVRSTIVQEAGNDEQLSRIVEQSALRPDQTLTTVVNSRFVVRERNRARLLIPPLFRHVYRTALSSGVTHSILAARPSLIPIFERFGFVAAATAFLDEIAGPMVIMKLDLHDRDRLANIGSPLLPDYDDFFNRRSIHGNPS